jgi:Na+-translocating ferredoxin:NAD+ oxidoreductase RnfD subunit
MTDGVLPVAMQAADNLPVPAAKIAPVASPLHSGIGVTTFYSLHVLGALFPLTAGLLLYGWRAAGVTAVVMGSAAAAAAVWRRIGTRGRQVRVRYCLWLGLILSLMLPAQLFTLRGSPAVWPILPAAGICVVIFSWLLGGLGTERIHPSLATTLVLCLLFAGLMTPRYVLRVDRMFLGDLLKSDDGINQARLRSDPWMNAPPPGPYDSLMVESPGQNLLAYTASQQHTERASLTVQMLIRDQMPALEDLIIGGQSAAIGAGSAIAIIVGGLFLLYRGLIDFRIPLLATIAAMIALLILPIPVLITDTRTEWHWLAFREHYLGWSTAITFVNYEILAGPLLFTVFFLATAPGIRPLSRRGRTIFAIVLGVLAGVFQLYASVLIGPYIALLVASLLTPTMDRRLKPRTLV